MARDPVRGPREGQRADRRIAITAKTGDFTSLPHHAFLLIDTALSVAGYVRARKVAVTFLEEVRTNLKNGILLFRSGPHDVARSNNEGEVQWLQVSTKTQ